MDSFGLKWDRCKALERVVALNGGGEALHALYAAFSDEDLAAALAGAEAAARRHGTLEAKWSEAGDRLITGDDAQG